MRSRPKKRKGKKMCSRELGSSTCSVKEGTCYTESHVAQRLDYGRKEGQEEGGGEESVTALRNAASSPSHLTLVSVGLESWVKGRSVGT